MKSKIKLALIIYTKKINENVIKQQLNLNEAETMRLVFV